MQTTELRKHQGFPDVGEFDVQKLRSPDKRHASLSAMRTGGTKRENG
jgi:hypothetical protein